MYLIIGKVDEHIECNSVEEKYENKYLAFDSIELHSTDENKEVLETITELWDEIETINGRKKGEYGKDLKIKIKIKFNTDDNLPLNKPLKLHLLTMIVRCIFKEHDKFHPELYLDECLHEL